MISALVVRNGVDHLSEVRAIFLSVRVVARGWIRQRHRAIARFDVVSVGIVVAAAILGLVTVDEDQIGRLRLLETLRELCLAPARGLAFKASDSLPPAHWRV